MSHFTLVVPESLARPPRGLEFAARAVESLGEGDVLDLEAEKERCGEVLERLHATLNPATRQRHTPGSGAVGIALEASPFCHHLERDGVSVVFAGEVSYWPGHDTMAEAHDAFMRGEEPPVHDDAEWLLDFYQSFSMHANASDVTEAALRALSLVSGPFAFVVFDSLGHRVWAGRDATGAQPLYWGTTLDGILMFGTDATKLDECCNPSVTPFPAGTLFASSGNTFASFPGENGWVITGEEQPGRLLSFVQSSSPRAGHPWRDIKAVPRIKPDGVLCGAVYRVASEQQLGGGIRGF
ncbi:hypothetical protein N2152v2_005767 [Parachlorella kessleri]